MSGRSVQAYRIPIAYDIRSLDDHPWGLRLNLPVSIGIHDLRAVVEGEDELRTNLRTFTFEPGVEARLPVRWDWVLKPFAEIGFSRELSTGGEWALLYGTGLKALRELPRGRHLWSFGAGVEWDGYTAVSGMGGSGDYALVEGGVDFRFPLVAGVLPSRFPDASVYLVGRHFFEDIVFEGDTTARLAVEDQLEVGLTFGSTPALELLGVKLPRLGLSYRFGGDLTAWRFNFGFPF